MFPNRGHQTLLGLGCGQVEVDHRQPLNASVDAGGEVVDDEHIVSAFGEQPHHVRTDIACPSGHQNCH